MPNYITNITAVNFKIKTPHQLMNTLTLLLISDGLALAAPTDDYITKAPETHGEFGEIAARFLIKHMSENNKKSVSTPFLNPNRPEPL